MSKQWFPYFGLAVAPAKEPAPPTWQRLDKGGGRVIDTHRISAAEFGMTLTFSSRIGNQAYSWNWTACSQDTEAETASACPAITAAGVAASAPPMPTPDNPDACAGPPGHDRGPAVGPGSLRPRTTPGLASRSPVPVIPCRA
ncbi:MAG: hypothetical protein ACR2MP_16015 [Streptosporangiaceae bacterium]